MKTEQLERQRQAWVGAYVNKTKRLYPGESLEAGVERANAAFDREAMLFCMLVNSNQNLTACTELSLQNAFLGLGTNAISIEQTDKAECYLIPRGNTASLKISPYGAVVIRQMAGQIKRIANPIILYEGDHFQPYTNEKGDLCVEYKAQFPRKANAKVIGAFLTIYLPDGSKDYSWMFEDEFARLQGYAKKGGGNVANYTSFNGGIDPGLAAAKVTKHAFRAYPKIQAIGQNVEMDTDTDEVPGYQPAPEPIDDGNRAHDPMPPTPGTTSFNQPEDEETF